MLSVVPKLLALLPRRDRIRFFLLLMLLIALALTEMAGVASIMPFMAVVTNPEIIHTNQWLNTAYSALNFGTDEGFLVFLGVGVLALLILNNAGKAINTWLTLRYQNRLVYELSGRLLARYMARPYAFFLGRNTAQLANTILFESNRVISSVLSPIMELVASALVCLALMVLLIIVDPIVAFAIAAVIGGSYAAIYILARRKLGVISKEQVEANDKKFKNAGEALSGIMDLKILGREWTFLERYIFYAARHARNNVAAGVIVQLPRFALEITAFGGILMIVIFLIGQGEQTAQMVPLLALYAFAGYRLMPALQQLFGAVSQLRFGFASLERVYDEMAREKYEVDDPVNQLRLGAKATPLRFTRSLELRNLRFRYDDAKDESLRGLNLAIEPNTTVGFVGPTGCGKTTVANLVLGLLSPTEGEILVDGTPITDANRANWQRSLGYVPQHIYISDDTVARNIAFGVPDDEIDMAAVHRAAVIANLADFVEQELPDGYATAIGERGVRLSGGQRQRIGIARAMYHEPAILVMDEATSALDGITEESVMDAVRNLSRQKTIILIAHRLTTVKDCDVIYQLDRGRILTSGRFDELMRESHWFRAAAGG
jgi:ATP-binding cassette, subfamily B, bacterial PglK